MISKSFKLYAVNSDSVCHKGACSIKNITVIFNVLNKSIMLNCFLFLSVMWYCKLLLGAPVIDNYDSFGVCIRNCGQCKKMFGPYFEGQLCAESCVRDKGVWIPDCESLGSIRAFLSVPDKY